MAKLIELNNHLTRVATGGVPREVAEPLVLMMAPVTPHLAEELWASLGHPGSLAYEPFPVADPTLLVEDTLEYPVQVNGKVRGHVLVAAAADAAVVEAAALADSKVQAALAGRVAEKGHRRARAPRQRRRLRPTRGTRPGPTFSAVTGWVVSTTGAVRALLGWHWAPGQPDLPSHLEHSGSAHRTDTVGGDQP